MTITPRLFEAYLKCPTKCFLRSRVPCHAPSEPAQFTPVRFIFTNKLSRYDKLMLAFDAVVLSETLGRKVDFGKILHGDNFVTLRVQTAALDGEVRKITAEIATLLTSQVPPDLVLNRHCAECEYQKQCRQKAVEKDDLSLLACITEDERSRHRSKGISRSHSFLIRSDRARHQGERRIPRGPATLRFKHLRSGRTPFTSMAALNSPTRKPRCIWTSREPLTTTPTT
jgi:hypothetical protein